MNTIKALVIKINGLAIRHAEGELDTLAFSVLENIRPMIETALLEQAADAYARMTLSSTESVGKS